MKTLRFFPFQVGTFPFLNGNFYSSSPYLDGKFPLSSPSLDGRGLRGGCDKQFIRIISKTPFVLVNTSLFQNLRTLNP